MALSSARFLRHRNSCSELRKMCWSNSNKIVWKDIGETAACRESISERSRGSKQLCGIGIRESCKDMWEMQLGRYTWSLSWRTLDGKERTRKFSKDCRWGYDVILFAFWQYQCARSMEDDWEEQLGRGRGWGKATGWVRANEGWQGHWSYMLGSTENLGECEVRVDDNNFSLEHAECGEL